MIESRSNVEEKVANDRADSRGRLRQLHAQTQIAINVLLGNDLALAITEPVQNLEYGCQMFLCPDQFETRTL